MAPSQTGYAPNLAVYLKSFKNANLDEMIESLISFVVSWNTDRILHTNSRQASKTQTDQEL